MIRLNHYFGQMLIKASLYIFDTLKVDESSCITIDPRPADQWISTITSFWPVGYWIQRAPIASGLIHLLVDGSFDDLQK